MSGDINSDVIKKTQKVLGKHIKKPPLTEKLLRKPPFRFLHDIVTTVIKDTGFLKGLFTDLELNSENVKEKDAKIAFLNKLINAVKSITGSELAVRSSKIVAGLEPTETNLLLQALGRALDKKLDSSEYVKSIKAGAPPPEPKKSKKSVDKEEKSKVKKNAEEKKDTAKKLTKKRSPSKETPRSTDRTKSNDSTNNTGDKPKRSSKEKSKETKQKTIKAEPAQTIIENEEKTEIKPEIKTGETDDEKVMQNGIKTPRSPEVPKPLADIQENVENKVDVSDNQNEETTQSVDKTLQSQEEAQIDNTSESHVFKRQNSSSLVRPKSARPKSGERDRLNSAKPKPPEILRDPMEMTTQVTNTPVSSRPKSSLRPPSVRPSSARPGAPRLRPESALPVQETVTMGNINVIVENFDTADDEETVVIQTTAEIPEDVPIMSELKVPEDNQGHLVEQILKEIEKEGDDVKRKVDIDWEGDTLRGKEATNKEISHLRTMIQNLTKTANPLGKLLNYLHEDIEAMQSELQMWSNTKKQLIKEMEKQKKITSESNKPLLMQLEQVQEEIKKQEQDIINVRSNILRNDQRIKELLIK